MAGIRRTRFAFGVALATALITAHSASAYTYKVIHDFCSKRLCADGNSPTSGVIMDGAGNLYGTTLYGGTAYDAAGVAYELTPDAQRAHWKSRTIHTFAFNHQNGGAPWAAPILDTSGNLYGTTLGGGSFDHGTVYELVPNGDKTARTLKLLASLSDYIYPNGGLTYQGAATGVPFNGTSPLYGTTTQNNSPYLYGSVFQLTLSGGAWNLDTLYTFCRLANCQDGSKPMAAVTLDANGHVFGTAATGGQFNQGVAYELVETGGTWTYSRICTISAGAREMP